MSNSNEEPSQWISGVILAIAGTFLFALKSIFIKLAYAEGASKETVLMLRMLIATPFYAGMLIYLRKIQHDKPDVNWKKAAHFMSLGFLGYYLASFLDLAGLELITAQLERLTLFTYPTMIAVLAWMFLGEKITLKIIASLLFCYIGLYMMYAQERFTFNNDNATTGVILVLGAALSYSIYVILSKSSIQKYGSRKFTSIAMLGSTLFVSIHFLSTQQISDLWAGKLVWFHCFMLSFFCTVIPSFMVTEAIARIGATRTTILGSAGPVFTIVIAVFTLGEPFTYSHLVGIILVLCGVFLVSKKNKTSIRKA